MPKAPPPACATPPSCMRWAHPSASSSSPPTRRTGPMTGVERFSAALALVLAAWPAAADTPAPWFGLADLRQPGTARVYALQGRAEATPARLHYLPLAPSAG